MIRIKKTLTSRRIMLVGASLVLLSLLVFSTQILDQFKLMAYYNMVPFDVVFDEGIDLKQYDGSVILNCLRDKNFCPEGVHYKDDVTGEVFPSNPEQPKTTQPYVPPEDPNAPPDPRLFDTKVPTDVQNMVFKADIFAYVMYGGIVTGLGILILYLLKKRKSRQKTI